MSNKTGKVLSWWSLNVKKLPVRIYTILASHMGEKKHPLSSTIGKFFTWVVLTTETLASINNYPSTIKMRLASVRSLFRAFFLLCYDVMDELGTYLIMVEFGRVVSIFLMTFIAIPFQPGAALCIGRLGHGPTYTYTPPIHIHFPNIKLKFSLNFWLLKLIWTPVHVAGLRIKIIQTTGKNKLFWWNNRKYVVFFTNKNIFSHEHF